MQALFYLLPAALTAIVMFFVWYSVREIPPSLLWYKVCRRVSNISCTDHPNLHDAPYRRAAKHDSHVHSPILLNLATSEGTGQACHPDVVHIPQGFGSQNWRYWMACTPYPYKCDIFENPEIFASHDGVFWEIPDGLKNPVVSKPPLPGDHNSDTDLLFHRGQLWLYFRETHRVDNGSENRLLLTTSSDGIAWSAPVEVIGHSGGTELLSPAVINDDRGFVMWTVEKVDGTFQIIRRNSEDGRTWNRPMLCQSRGLAEGRALWHIDVIQEEDRLSALLVTTAGQGGSCSRLHYAYSLDKGQSWTIGPFLLEQVYEFESGCQYRATLVKQLGEANVYQIWYSAATKNHAWSIAYLRMRREENRLLY